MPESNQEKNFLKYATGRFYKPKRRTDDFPFLEGDMLNHVKLGVFGSFLGYDTENNKYFVIIKTPDGNECQDVVSNWQLTK